MNAWAGTFTASVGKKVMMAVTGLSFIGFLVMHLLGNLTMYGGGDAFNAYAEKLHSLGVLLKVAEWGLLAFALVHVITGGTLVLENFRARPVRYAMKKRAGGRTLGSATMPYTGVALILFVVFHLINFHFVDKSQTTIFQIVLNAFQSPWYVAIYVAAMVIAGVHVSHGLWSAFQTLGANHPKYMPLIRILSVVFAVVVGIGFGSLPIYISFVS
ncbi:MAG: succinate dehydrogenase cytochrome b subunit [Desulfobacterales bacterium]|jgi:succinate dehydrogenase / fumarate reductase cytochrome b subunit|nr:succinate dehydrogenase cytochrome b subunit [Desulfobacterales bacterium]